MSCHSVFTNANKFVTIQPNIFFQLSFVSCLVVFNCFWYFSFPINSKLTGSFYKIVLRTPETEYPNRNVILLQNFPLLSAAISITDSLRSVVHLSFLSPPPFSVRGREKLTGIFGGLPLLLPVGFSFPNSNSHPTLPRSHSFTHSCPVL